ncbi:MAG: hypothetical protein CVT89_01320 [Candidatus Altiarchaeales archaeon HGW-Altiarchaeales-2]|nr:MAG: hypothetical protein CVT89_01320 [Candidatus Altiarchaeales archaeon HGW-Altiarchaeales-2]
MEKNTTHELYEQVAGKENEQINSMENITKCGGEQEKSEPNITFARDLTEIKKELNSQSTDTRSQQPPLQEFSNAQPIWHLVLLSIATFSFYEIYWFYRNWKHLKAHVGLDISPGWRTVGLFVPLVGLVLEYDQFNDIRKYARNAGCMADYSPGLLLSIVIICNVIALHAPDPYWLIGFLGVLPLTVVQAVLNSYWEKEQQEFKERTSFSWKQIILLIIGGLFWALVIISMFIPE